MEAAPSVVWDGLIVPGGEAAAGALAESGHALEFLKDQYRHCKPILLYGAAEALLQKAGIPVAPASGENDAALLRSSDDEVEAGVTAFVDALTQHRHFARETDPPRV
jgi:catalase